MAKIVIVHQNPDRFGEHIGLPDVEKPVKVGKTGEISVDENLAKLLVENSPSWKYKQEPKEEEEAETEEAETEEEEEEETDDDTSPEGNDNTEDEATGTEDADKAPDTMRATLEKNFPKVKELKELAKIEKLKVHPAVSTQKGMITLILANWANMSQTTRGKLMILDKKTQK